MSSSMGILKRKVYIRPSLGILIPMVMFVIYNMIFFTPYNLLVCCMNTFSQLEFHPSAHDYAFSIHHSTVGKVVLLFYVADTIVVGSNFSAFVEAIRHSLCHTS